MTRNLYLDYAKGILIVLVTIGHTLQHAVYQGGDFWSDPLFKGIYMFHMPLFMGISGFLSYPGIQRNDLPGFIRRKLKSYLLPIVAWAILYKTASFAVFAGESLIALPLTILREAIDGLWFLWALLASLILTAMIKAMRWQFWPVYVLTGVIVLLLPDGGNLTMFKYMFPYFGAGYCVASWGNRVLPPKCEWALFLGASVASVTLYCLWNKQTYISSSGMALVDGNYYNVLLRFAAGLFASISMLFVMNHLFHRTPVWLKHLIEQFGQDSIYIYIVQVYVFKVILRLAHAYDPFTNRAVGQVVAVVMGIGVAWLCWMGGRLLSTNETLGLILFGKPRKHPAGFDVGAGQRTP